MLSVAGLNCRQHITSIAPFSAAERSHILAYQLNDNPGAETAIVDNTLSWVFVPLSAVPHLILQL